MPGLAVVLASRSPQRSALLRRLGIEFTIRAGEVAEIERGQDPAAVAIENALRKVRAAAALGAAGRAAPAAAHATATPGATATAPEVREIVIGCDTIVVLEGVIYGKPPDADAARRTLRALGGHTHEVLSGLAVLVSGEQRTALARTRVTFRAIDEQLLEWYVAGGEWRGRSGGYAIQGAGARLATGIEGDEENVVGLPLATLLELCPELYNA
jgi:nucleoside triphosphate pyrophosphatase